VPFAIVLGEDELAQGKVKVKEMGLPNGHPEKEGVLVEISSLVSEVRQRIARITEVDELAQEVAGVKVEDASAPAAPEVTA
jgi:histidyl-tRNA synthetase